MWRKAATGARSITELMGVQAPPGLLGIHTNMPGAVPPEIDKAAFAGGPPPSGLSAEEKQAYDQLASSTSTAWATRRRWGTARRRSTGSRIRPSAWPPGSSTTTSRSYELIARVFDGQSEGLTRDDILDNITLYWLTNTAVSSARLYWENKLAFFAPKNVTIPVAVSAFPGRDLSGPAKLGRAGVSQADPLQQLRQGRPLRRVGAADCCHIRTPSGVSIAALKRPDRGIKARNFES